MLALVGQAPLARILKGYALNRRLAHKTPLKSRILLLHLRFWGLGGIFSLRNSRFILRILG